MNISIFISKNEFDDFLTFYKKYNNQEIFSVDEIPIISFFFERPISDEEYINVFIHHEIFEEIKLLIENKKEQQK